MLASYAQGAGIDEPLASLSAAGTAFSEADGLGSITSLSGMAGITDTYTYNAFGVTTATGGNPNRFRYTGREWDPETGLYYYRARYYDPQTGRFVGEDPLGFGAGDINLYRYVANGPADSNDPFGLRILPKPGPGKQGGVDLTDYYAALAQLSQDHQAGAIIAQLSNAAQTYNIVFIHDGNDRYDPTTQTIYWDPRSAMYCDCGGSQSPANGLFHEMAHAAGGSQTTALGNIPDRQYDDREERRVIVNFEKPFSLRHGECVRKNHNGTVFDAATPTSNVFVRPAVPRPPLPAGLQ